MCRDLTNIDTDVLAAVAVILDDLVADTAMFTAFDVTRLARKELDHVPHKDVRAIVNEEMDEGFKLSGYTRQMLTVAGRQARVFFPVNSDPAEYDPAALKPSQKVYNPVLGFDV